AVALQQGPELERLIGQLAESSSQDLVQSWGVKLRADVPRAQIEKAAENLNVELKKYNDDVSKIIKNKVNKASADSLIPVYMERFSLDELKQLVAFFESPAVKKYQLAAPELGNVFVNQLIMETRADVSARAKIFDDAATKIVGSAPKAPAPAATAPAAAPDKSKPAAKK
ncbi:MAG: DUF2059 domain-containing protein, partial [Polaromonas sp.]|nr:DUF2059 domain-containing protein [Polaromonas sp.]